MMQKFFEHAACGIFTLGIFVLMSIYPQQAHARCNTRDGIVADQPNPPPEDEVNLDVAVDQPINSSVIQNDRLNNQTLKLDLSKDIDTLIGFGGHLTNGVPVLGVRMENLPSFNAKKHCNAVQPILYKPTIERLPTGALRASVENGRFHVEVDPTKLRTSWIQDSDPTQQFFWIFPAIYGRAPDSSKPWSLTGSYDAMFSSSGVGSVKRRWVAEAYLNLSMRLYRERKLSRGYPTGRRPTRADLEAAIGEQIGQSCDPTNTNLICLASTLIEENEAAPPGNLISADAFRAGDALLENSGVSAGIRQLDFGGRNEQASQLVKQLLPSTVGRYDAGYGYRRAIRTWDIFTLNKWYGVDGPAANAELSREEAKKLLLSSHSDFLKTAVDEWTSKVSAAYPNWDAQQQEALELVSIDLENVTGYKMRLAKDVQNACDVLVDSRLSTDGRSNRGVTSSQIKRVRNGVKLLTTFPQMISLNWTCLDTL